MLLSISVATAGLDLQVSREGACVPLPWKPPQCNVRWAEAGQEGMKSRHRFHKHGLLAAPAPRPVPVGSL